MFIKAEIRWWHVLVLFQPFKSYNGQSYGLHLATGPGLLSSLVCWLPGDFFFFISDMILLSPSKDMCLIQTFKKSVKTNICIHLSHITKNILR